MGPLLFLIYINDIVDNIASEIYLFADDTSLINIGNNWLSVEEMLNDDLKKLSIWSKNWLLTFNALKTEYMQISSKRSSVEPINLKLNNQLLSCVNTHKHLGLMLNDNFSWSDHIDCVCKRVNMRLAVLRKLRCCLNRSCLLKLYCSWVRPVIEYGSVCYDNLTIADINRLEKLQRRALLICTGAQFRTETSKLLNEVGLISLQARRLNAKLILFFKIKARLTPVYLYNDLLSLNIFSNRLNSSRLLMPRCRTIKSKNSFFPSAVHSWNGLMIRHRTEFSSLRQFINFISVKVNIKQIKAYNNCIGFYAQMLTQIRLGLNNLRGDLFTFNLSDNPVCPLCIDAFESAHHFFLACPSLHVQRNEWMVKLRSLVSDIDSYKQIDLLRVCIHGSANSSFEFNSSILRSTIEFIKSSNRFSSLYCNCYLNT